MGERIWHIWEAREVGDRVRFCWHEEVILGEVISFDAQGMTVQADEGGMYALAFNSRWLCP